MNIYQRPKYQKPSKRRWEINMRAKIDFAGNRKYVDDRERAIHLCRLRKYKSDLKLVIACGFFLIHIFCSVFILHNKLVLISWIFHKLNNKLKPNNTWWMLMYVFWPTKRPTSQPTLLSVYFATRRLDCVLFFIIYADS